MKNGIYPKWLYHPEKPARIVRSEDEHKALGPKWVESPAECESKPSHEVCEAPDAQVAEAPAEALEAPVTEAKKTRNPKKAHVA